MPRRRPTHPDPPDSAQPPKSAEPLADPAPFAHSSPGSLAGYRAKRDFTRTPEPTDAEPTDRGPDAPLRYCVQKHDATNLHYDFRLELGGVLLSWALPKGPSLDPASKPLAMRVEDHPLAYADFEGVIPENNYGAGTVMLWDTGTWRPINEPTDALAKGDLKFTLSGAKLKGEWAIVRMKTRDAPDNAWLLIKKRDAHARHIGEYNVLAQLARSVASGRTMAEIARDRDAEWRSRPVGTPPHDPPDNAARAAITRNAKPRAAPGGAAPSDAAQSHGAPLEPHTPQPAHQEAVAAPPLVLHPPAQLPGAARADPPDTLAPQLATLAHAPPEGEGWIHETKLDGYRLMAHLLPGPPGAAASRVILRTRNGHDWTDRVPALARELARLPMPGSILDGELVALDARSVPDFGLLQAALGTAARDQLVFYVFDLPFALGHDLRRAPLAERKTYLRAALAAAGAGERFRYLDHLVGKGALFHQHAIAAGFEGTMAKRANAPYESRRSASWLKIKATTSDDFIVVGWTPPEGSRSGFGSLLLARHAPGGELLFQGSVGSGFTDRDLALIRSQLDARAADRRPLAAPLPTPADERAARWVRPELVVEVGFAGRTGEGMLRHPVFKGLRADVDASDVPPAEAPPEHAPAAASSARGVPRAASGPRAAVVMAARAPSDALVAGVRISNPDRFVYPEAAITKREVAEYYAAAAPRMLPHVAHRALSLVRCPLGLAGEHFYQRHLAEGFPPQVKGMVIDDDPDGPSIVIHDREGLVALAQMGVLEVHPWNARTDRPDRPDRIILDLDPGDGLAWPDVVAAARFVRSVVERLGLQTFVKTSGGRGVHLLAPIARRHTWDEVKSFTRAIAKELARVAPMNFVAQMTKALRTNRVYTDFLRNQKGATAVGPYSTRAREAATVSMPLTWDELSPETPPEAYTIRSAAARLAPDQPDPWAGFFEVRQSITAPMRRAVGLED